MRCDRRENAIRWRMDVSYIGTTARGQTILDSELAKPGTVGSEGVNDILMQVRTRADPGEGLEMGKIPQRTDQDACESGCMRLSQLGWRRYWLLTSLEDGRVGSKRIDYDALHRLHERRIEHDRLEVAPCTSLRLFLEHRTFFPGNPMRTMQTQRNVYHAKERLERQ
jgi:hypothetical protein